MLCHVPVDSSQYLVKPHLSFPWGLFEIIEVEMGVSLQLISNIVRGCYGFCEDILLLKLM